MTIMELGALGEFLGSVAVLATLVYLSVQIRHANTQSQAAARYSFIDAYGQLNLTIVQDKGSASVWRRGLEADDIDDDEKMRFFKLFGQFFNTWSVLYDLYQEQQLPDNQWIVVRKDILAALRTPGGREYWNQVGMLCVHPSLSRAVQTILDSDEESYDFPYR